ncbi:MAG: cysteine hydrolase [Clostridia bacterium]|nr:cysteine hydrolase [Clostridia bacterium]
MNDKKALVVIDMQNDYLWEKRKAKFSYDTETLVGNVNAAIKKYSEKGYDIIYVKMVFPNIITNRLAIGFSIDGTEGAELYGGLNVVSDLCFEKSLPNSYFSKEFRDHMKTREYSEVVLCGLDEYGCVGATAKGAAEMGVRTFVLKDATGTRFPYAKVKRMRHDLDVLGVEYI